MSMSDPIADLLTRIRNALQAHHPSVEIPGSRVKREICRVLQEEGYIKDVEFEESPAPGMIRVELKYTRKDEPTIEGLKRISKPSLRVYAGSDEIKPVRSTLGIAILSTSQGVMTGQQARKASIGGEILCEVW